MAQVNVIQVKLCAVCVKETVHNGNACIECMLKPYRAGSKVATAVAPNLAVVQKPEVRA